MVTHITARDARRLALAPQGLLRRDPFGRGKHAVARAVKRLGYVQIDTISVVERAHHHVLATRVENYEHRMLDELQSRDRGLFEFWHHAAAYLPMADYRHYLPAMAHFRDRHRGHGFDTAAEEEVLARIRAEGPLQSRDFLETAHRSTGWWDWKPAKLALESLFLKGDLMVTRRDGFQKVYDLRERVLPAQIDVTVPSEEEWTRALVHRALGAHGLATARQISFLRNSVKKIHGNPVLAAVKKSLQHLVEAGEVVQVEAGGKRYYSTPAQLEQLPRRIGRRIVRILSPFDNLVIQRERGTDLFGFDYLLESYVPAGKRRYGYFSLPILHGDLLVGRMDAKAVRRDRKLLIRNLVFEDSVRGIDDLKQPLIREIQRFARFNGCHHVLLERTEPRRFHAAISQSVARC